MFAKDKYKPNLFNQDSDSDDGGNPSGSFGTNAEFAKNFNKLRSKELLKKHQNASDSDSSSDSDDSSDNDTINPKFDEAFYKALASIKKKDPNIYTDNVKFFDDFDAAGPSGSGNKATAIERVTKKPMTIVDYERKILLERGGRYDEDDDNDDEDGNGGDDDGNAAGRPQSPSYIQEQQNLRAEFKKVIDADSDDDDAGSSGEAAAGGDDDGNAEWGGIFKRREKSKAEEAAEEKLYTKWLAGEAAANIGENAATLQPLKEYWANPKLAKEEVFLRDYILNNGYTQKSSSQVPCYDDIVGNRQSDDDEEAHAADKNLSDDEAELEKQAEFEHKFNFRFEEPDADFIKRYPRTIENSVRRTDDRRKDKRQEVKDRKQREKDEKLRELEMLSAMRKREIEEKLSKLKMVSGEEAALCFDDADLDGDFDPEEHDRKMQAVFNSEYYGVDEGDEKPECPAELLDLQIEDWDNYDPQATDGDGEPDGHCEDEDFDMDCEVDAEQQRKAFQSELIESTRAGGKRKRKRKSKFMQLLQAEKPVFDPNDNKSFGEYLDEYYKLDYEDVVGDVPCRFKYSETVPNDFGLTVEEILLAKNRELNQWASLKKATQIRPEHVERNEIGLFKQKGKNEALKRKILQSLYEVPSDEEEDAPKPSEKASKKSSNKKAQPVSVKTVDNFVTIDANTEKVILQTEQKKKKLQSKATVDKAHKTTTEKVKTKKPKTPTPLSVVSAAAVAETTKAPVDVAKTNQKRALDQVTPIKKAPPAKKPKLDSSAGNPDKKVIANAKPQQKTPAITTAKPQRNGQKKQANGKPGAKKSTTHKAAAKSADAISDERLRAFGINPKKFHKKQKYGTTTKPANSVAGSAANTPNGKANTNGVAKRKNINGKNANNRQPNRQRGGGAAKPAKGANREALERMKAKMFAAKKATA